ncbi:putative AC9 transposase [Merluccius polli]|uniref:AC9 transposase n=1 Tax=Merluccius polli TaxID=89951 RepID=A0AA47NBW2_MERPO|nr:putative AC9 transposase [Merluccius polli]KAK0138579.1 putative AC9 transposase [Merluccius polli]KAK0150004.1 putative AC9 transposase [Merluccius polli]KAK0156177.1 putative AC9 transposase [Merluccius polli]
MASQSDPPVAFFQWKYRHYFSYQEKKGTSVSVKCTLCPGVKCLSTSVSSNSNLMKHLSTAHASTTLVAKTPEGKGDGGTKPKQQKIDFTTPHVLSQTELNKGVARYVVEDMLPLSTVESASFRELVSKIPVRGGVRLPCRKTFSNYIDAQYAEMNVELKRTFDKLEYLSTTADIWTACNKSYLGVTAHWINPQSMERGKAALACRRFKGRHTHDKIATELDNIHSSYGISHKITTTVTDNGSNFVKAFKKYQPVEQDDSDDDEDEVTFTNISEALQTPVDDEENVITLPPHQRCASHTLNLVSCTDIDKWLLSTPGTKAVYRSATTKCTGLWNKASRSTVAAETVHDVISKKLLVPCTTRWNSFYDALDRICGIPMVELNTISSKFGLTAITEREHQFIREYCTVMKPLTVALDILQGEDRCYHGTLLPTLETLIFKTLQLKSGLHILIDLPEAIVTAIKTRFAEVLESEDAVLAAVTLPKFKLRWLRTQDRKDKAKASLLAECRKIVLYQDQQEGTSQPTRHLSTDSAIEDEFFSFEDEDDTSAAAESQVGDYLKSGEQGIESLNRFPLIKNISLKHNAATPSSAPVERLFSLGKLVLTPQRNRLSDQKFEKLLVLRYNHWFDGKNGWKDK